jgi:quinol monooxygenase YgiN
MHGLINRFTAHPGQRDAAMASMLSDVGPLDGCLSFVVARDPAHPDAFYLTEVWASPAHHQASLARPGVKASLDVLIPLIADWGTEVVTEPVGGIDMSGRF